MNPVAVSHAGAPDLDATGPRPRIVWSSRDFAVVGTAAQIAAEPPAAAASDEPREPHLPSPPVCPAVSDQPRRAKSALIAPPAAPRVRTTNDLNAGT